MARDDGKRVGDGSRRTLSSTEFLPAVVSADGSSAIRSSEVVVQGAGAALLETAERSERRSVPGRKLYQDEVYGTKELSPLAVALIDTPEFQRLSHIYQLGFTHTVFRGANHHRFEHSVGTYFMSRTLMRRIVQNHSRFYVPSSPDDFPHPGSLVSPRFYIHAPATPAHSQRRYSPMGRWRGLTELVSAAALLHDLGHIPVGHTLEDEFSVFQKHDALGGARLFEMLYGPRGHKDQAQLSGAGIPSAPSIADYFDRLDTSILAAPSPAERVPLPWVFEDATYGNFFAENCDEEESGIPSLSNGEIRDLIYLILSFKENIDRDPEKQRTFTEEWNAAYATADKDPGRRSRLQFIKALHDYYAAPVILATDQERLPMFFPFMADLIGNTICADLLDYLVRDGNRLRLDIRANPRLQRYLVIRPASAGSSLDSGAPKQLRLTINAVYRNGLGRRDTVSDLLDLMRERYRFSEVVYHHPKKAAFSAMLAKTIEILPEDKRPIDAGPVYPAPWAGPRMPEAKYRHVTHFGDESLISYLSQAAPRGHAVRELTHGITYRNEYRLLFTLDYDAAATSVRGLKLLIDGLRAGGDAGRMAMEVRLAEVVRRFGGAQTTAAASLVPVLIYCPGMRMQAKEVAAHVELMPGDVKPLNLHAKDQTLTSEIELLNQKYQRLWRLYMFVHPSLVARKATREHSMHLSALIDAFCHKSGVSLDGRRRGSRYPYYSFADRVDEAFDAWAHDFPVGRYEKDIREVVQDTDLWADVVHSDVAPFPVNQREYRLGFVRAAAIVVAERSTKSQRQRWPDRVRRFKAADWHRPATVPDVDQARKEVLTRFGALSDQLVDTTAGTSERQPSWEAFSGRVLDAISGR